MTLPDPEAWKQLSPLLDELLDSDDEARALRLAELRSRDPALAQRIESLLSASDPVKASGFLASNAGGDAAALTDLGGKRIGAYVIEASLGAGSTGSVWRARRADGRFDGAVAVKLLHLSLIGRAGALRFEREGRILARVVHPNIARLLDAGVTAEGQPYLVLELVAGERIDQHCNALQLDVDQRLKLFADVLAAVSHAHSHLVIHRDIKPNNILVAADGTVKLLDFGIAKLIGDEAEANAITLDGRSVLTPEYAAPEQLQGGPITTATDVYALGVLLYRLLTGLHPTGGDTATASTAELMRSTLDDEPVGLVNALDRAAPDTLQQMGNARGTTPSRLRRRLEGDLENIVSRTLQKRPDDRYRTVTALAEDVRRHIAHEPVSARPDSWSYRCAKFVRRHRAMVAAGLAVVLAVALGLVGTATQARRADAQAVQARHERDKALLQLAYTKSSSDFIAFLLSESLDKPFTTAELLERAEPVLQREFAGAPAQRAHLLTELAGLHLTGTNLKKAESLLVSARAAAKEVPDVSLQVGIECLVAYLHGLNDAFEAAQKTFDAVFEQIRTAPDVDRALVGQCLQFRGDVADMRGDTPAAFADLQAALGAIRDPKIEDRTQAISTRNSFGILLGKMGRPAAAAAEFRNALAELEDMGRGRTMMAGAIQQNMAVLLSRAGQSAASFEADRRALDIARGFDGVTPSLESNYAADLVELGRVQEAIPLIEHAIAGAKSRGDRRTAANIAIQGARAWCLSGDLPRCATIASAGKSELVALLPAGHASFGNVALCEARLALAHGDLSQARARLREAEAIFAAATEQGRPRIRVLTLLARVELRLGDLDAAEADAARATAQAREALAGFDHSEWLGSALVAQGMVQHARGQHTAAEASWRAALVELEAAAGDAATATVEARSLLRADGTMNLSNMATAAMR